MNWTGDFRIRSVCSAAFAAAIILTVTASVTCGQIGQDFPTVNQPIQDAFVSPADFNQEIQSDAPSQSEPFNIGEKIERLSEQTFGEQSGSLIDGLRHQFGDVDVPRVLGSLAIVLGGYFGLVWFTRRFSGGGNGRLPNEVVEVLGQTPFKPGSNLQLVRLGSKLLLLMNGTEGTHAIGEISDPDEVALLCAKCGVASPSSRPRAQIGEPTTTLPRSASDNNPTKAPNTDLKTILRQLQRVADSSGNGAIFEA